MTADNAKVNKNGMPYVAQAFIHMGKTTSQPSKPENENVLDSEIEYVLANDTDAEAKNSAENVLLRYHKNEEENHLNVCVKEKLDKDFSTVTVTGIDDEQGGKPLVKVRTGHKADEVS